MWALGVMTYILLSGSSPFLGVDQQSTYQNILALDYSFPERNFPDTSDLAKDFIRTLFIKDPRKRSTVEQALSHPWIKPVGSGELQQRRKSSVNVERLKGYNARRHWRHAVRLVILINRIRRYLDEARAKRQQLDKNHSAHLRNGTALSSLSLPHSSRSRSLSPSLNNNRPTSPLLAKKDQVSGDGKKRAGSYDAVKDGGFRGGVGRHRADANGNSASVEAGKQGLLVREKWPGRVPASEEGKDVKDCSSRSGLQRNGSPGVNGVNGGPRPGRKDWKLEAHNGESSLRARSKSPDIRLKSQDICSKSSDIRSKSPEVLSRSSGVTKPSPSSPLPSRRDASAAGKLGVGDSSCVESGRKVSPVMGKGEKSPVDHGSPVMPRRDKSPAKEAVPKIGEKKPAKVPPHVAAKPSRSSLKRLSVSKAPEESSAGHVPAENNGDDEANKEEIRVRNKAILSSRIRFFDLTMKKGGPVEEPEKNAAIVRRVSITPENKTKTPHREPHTRAETGLPNGNRLLGETKRSEDRERSPIREGGHVVHKLRDSLSPNRFPQASQQDSNKTESKGIVSSTKDSKVGKQTVPTHVVTGSSPVRKTSIGNVAANAVIDRSYTRERSPRRNLELPKSSKNTLSPSCSRDASPCRQKSRSPSRERLHERLGGLAKAADKDSLHLRVAVGRSSSKSPDRVSTQSFCSAQSSSPDRSSDMSFRSARSTSRSPNRLEPELGKGSDKKPVGNDTRRLGIGLCNGKDTGSSLSSETGKREVDSKLLPSRTREAETKAVGDRRLSSSPCNGKPGKLDTCDSTSAGGAGSRRESRSRVKFPFPSRFNGGKPDTPSSGLVNGGVPATSPTSPPVRGVTSGQVNSLLARMKALTADGDLPPPPLPTTFWGTHHKSTDSSPT